MTCKVIIITTISLLVLLQPSCHVGKKSGVHRQSLLLSLSTFGIYCICHPVSLVIFPYILYSIMCVFVCTCACTFGIMYSIYCQSQQPKELYLGSLQADVPFVPWPFIQKQNAIKGMAGHLLETDERTGQCNTCGVQDFLRGDEKLAES